MRCRIQVVFLAVALVHAISGDAQVKKLTMSGVVTDEKSHNPILGATVTAVGNEANSDTTTDGEGLFVLTFVRGVPEGSSVRIRVEKPGYKPYDRLVTVSSTVPLPVSLASNVPATKGGSSRYTSPKPQNSAQTLSRGIKEQTQATVAAATSPTFVEEIDKFNVSAGKISTTIHKGESACLIKIAEACLVKAYAENNRVVVDAAIYSGPGFSPLEVKKNQFSLNDPMWDRNFNDSAFEVLNAKLTPVLQIIYTTRNNVLINGLFQVGRTVYALSPAGFDTRGYPADGGVITKDDYLVHRIFKYPSRTYPGQEEHDYPITKTQERHTGPYAQLTNARLGEQVVREADQLAVIAEDCMAELERSAESGQGEDAVRSKYRALFGSCCLERMTALREEALSSDRPKNLADDSHEQFFYSIVRRNEPGNCGTWTSYAPLLKQIGKTLVNKPEFEHSIVPTESVQGPDSTPQPLGSSPQNNSQNIPASPNSKAEQGQSASINGGGSNNDAGNIEQNGNGNNAALGNNNAVGNTYNINSGPIRSGWLAPANDPMPDNQCAKEIVDGGGTVVFLGNVAAGSAHIFPQPILSVNERNKLTMYQNAQGEIAISTDIFDEHDDVVVSIEKNKFTISNDVFQVEYPDHSTLNVIIKHHKEKVLDIRFLNKNAIRIYGHFHYPDAPDIIADETGIHRRPMNITGGCLHDAVFGALFGF